MRVASERGLTLLSAALVTIYFFWFAGGGLFTDFMPDDLMNLGRARAFSLGELARDTLLWFVPSPTYRPFGAFWYSAIFELFGLWLLPARIAAYALLLASFWLLYRLARHSGASAETAGLAVLIWCYHDSFFALYYNNGTIYDILCTFFSLCILSLYAGWRRSGAGITWRRVAGLALLYIAALGSKEPAIAVPPLLLLWELLVQRSWRFPPRALVTLGAMSLPWFYTRVISGSMLTGLDAYRPVYSLARFHETFHRYLSELLNRPMELDPGYAYAFAALLSCAGLRLRDRAMLFGMALWLMAYLPLAFVEARAAYAIHLSTAGLALALAGAAVRGTQALLADRAPLVRRAALLLASLWGLIAFHSRPNLVDVGWMMNEARAIRSYWRALERAQLAPPRRGEVLLQNDPLRQWEWAATFAAQLYYRDPRIMVVGEGPVAERLGNQGWSQIWRWTGGGIECVKCGSAGGQAK